MSNEFSECYEVRNAGQKGRGLFATAIINRDEIITRVIGQVVKDRDINTPPFDRFSEISYKINESEHISPPVLDFQKLTGIFATNHSCDPNTGMRGNLAIVAMRTIEPGQEITIDYSMVDADINGMDCLPAVPIECLCGSSNCRNIITGIDWRRSDLQERYRGYFSTYVQSRIDRLNFGS